MARRQFALDLSRYHSRHVHGDITVYMTWWGDALEPCIVLVPTRDEGWERTTPCIVPQKQAWLWSEGIGDGRHCARASVEFLHHLRFTGSINAAMRVTSIIRDHLGDLLAMPPAPFERIVVADAIRIGNDGSEHYSEVTDRV